MEDPLSSTKILHSETVVKCSDCAGRGNIVCVTCNADQEPGVYEENQISPCVSCYGRGLIAHRDGSDTMNLSVFSFWEQLQKQSTPKDVELARLLRKLKGKFEGILMIVESFQSKSSKNVFNTDALETTNTVIWNRPMGVFEFAKFAVGTESVANKLAELSGRGLTTIIGGGDSVDAIEKVGVAEVMSHISTGGSASLELLEGIQCRSRQLVGFLRVCLDGSAPAYHIDKGFGASI